MQRTPVVPLMGQINDFNVLSDYSPPKYRQPSFSVRNPRVDAQSVLERWNLQKWSVLSTGCDIESYLALKSIQFKKYLFNIYIMQRAALKIQHWYFKTKAQQQR